MLGTGMIGIDLDMSAESPSLKGMDESLRSKTIRVYVPTEEDANELLKFSELEHALLIVWEVRIVKENMP